ncbi:caspase family protein [Emticicia fontis]
MKNVLIIIVLWGQIAFAQTKPTTTDPSKKAFIIAIANYPAGGGWEGSNPLSSQNDLELLRAVLLKQGFSSNNILVIPEEKATKNGVRDAFNAFKRTIKKGDKIIFHFSGHGQQVFDVSGDEPDQLDEALVLYDSPATLKGDSTYAGEKHLLDDELSVMLEDLRKAVGTDGHVVAFIDACHSGTAARGIGKMRGGRAAIVPKGKQLRGVKEKNNESGMIESASVGIGGLGKMVTFGGTASSQPNYEIDDDKSKKSYGSLTFAMSKAFAQLRSNTSYRQFFANIVNTVTSKLPGQTPMIEGDIDQVFFGGDVVEQVPYFTISEIDSDMVTLNAGQIHNLQPDTKIALYPSGTADPNKAKALFKGVVQSATSLSAKAKLDAPLPEGTEKNSFWAFITEYSYRDLVVKITTQGIDATAGTRIKKNLETLPNLLWVKTPEEADLILKQDSAQRLYLMDPKTTLSFGGSVAADKLKARIETFTKVKALKGFTGADEDLKVGIQINKNDGSDKCEYLKGKNEQNAVQQIRVGDRVCVCTKNLSDKDLYITILEFWPDGTFTQIYPANNRLEEPLKSGLERNYGGTVSIGPDEPYGQHIVKVFAAVGKQLDFKALEMAQFRGGDKNSLHPLEGFIYTRRGIGGLQNEDDNKVFTQTIVYQLEPR